MNNAVGYRAVVHKDPSFIIDYTCDVFSQKTFKFRDFESHTIPLVIFLEIHTNVKAVLNHTAYILI